MDSVQDIIQKVSTAYEKRVLATIIHIDSSLPGGESHDAI